MFLIMMLFRTYLLYLQFKVYPPYRDLLYLMLLLLGKRFMVTGIFAIKVPETGIKSLFYFLQIFLYLVELLEILLGSEADDVLAVFLDIQCFSFQYFIEHYLKACEFSLHSSAVIEDGLAYFGHGGF